MQFLPWHRGTAGGQAGGRRPAGALVISGPSRRLRVVEVEVSVNGKVEVNPKMLPAVVGQQCQHHLLPPAARAPADLASAELKGLTNTARKHRLQSKPSLLENTGRHSIARQSGTTGKLCMMNRPARLHTISSLSGAQLRGMHRAAEPADRLWS